MTWPITGLAALGVATERVAIATSRTPRRVWEACTIRGNRRVAVGVGSGVLFLYLLAIGDIVVSASGGLATTPGLQAAPSRVFDAKAPFLFEAALVVRPGPHLTLFVSPVNIILGTAVAFLAGLNIAVAQHVSRHASCRRTGYGRLFGLLPALGLGSACCAPTVLLALGTGTSASLLPVMIAVRPAFYPLTVVLLGASLVWTSGFRRGVPDRSGTGGDGQQRQTGWVVSPP